MREVSVIDILEMLNSLLQLSQQIFYYNLTKVQFSKGLLQRRIVMSTLRRQRRQLYTIIIVSEISPEKPLNRICLDKLIKNFNITFDLLTIWIYHIDGKSKTSSLLKCNVTPYPNKSNENHRSHIKFYTFILI